MSVCVTEGVVRWVLRSCSRRSPWRKHSFVVTASVKDTHFPSQLAHIWRTKQDQPCQARSLVSSVRFYSQGSSHAEDLQEKQVSGLPLPAETPRGQTWRGSTFLDKLQLCSSPSDVMDLTCQYAPTIRQVSNCLTHMWATTKKMTDEQRCCELQLMFEHPGFHKLLQFAMTSVNHMHNNDIAHSLLSMVNLGVPQRSRVIQTFLRACQVRTCCLR